MTNLTSIGTLVAAEVMIARSVFAQGSVTAFGEIIYIDALSSVILFIIGTVGLACSLYMRSYMEEQIACGVISSKRLNLFFRWMVRRDGIDLGLWEKVSPANLIIPLDTHIGKVAYQLRWISTPSLSWKKAEEITNILKKFDPDDPVRYDFSLCHESMSNADLVKSLTTKTRRTQRIY